MENTSVKGSRNPERSGSAPEHSHVSRDELNIARFGKRQRFKRNFGLLSIVGLSCTLMLTWEGSLAVLQPMILNGGPTGAFGGFIFVFAGVTTQTLVAAEIASMIPLSGGTYNWVAILAPRYPKFLSYMTGWLTTIAWQALLASVTYLNASIVQALAALANPNYEPERWQATLIVYAIIFLAVIMNTFLGKLLPGFEATILMVHILGFLGILFTLCYLGPKNSGSLVFTTFINGGEWSTNGQSFFIGSVTTMFAFVGTDAASHMAEEIENAAVVIPRSMIITCLLNGTLGLAMLIAILFTLGDLNTFLSSTFFFPFITVFQNITGSVAAAIGMTSIILIVTISGTFGLMAATSRMLWAFAREGGVPASRIISIVEPRSTLPIYSILTTALITMLLSLINIGSTTAFNAFTNLTVAGFYSTFMVAATIMLIRRTTDRNNDLQWGPFRLGKAGVPLTIIALSYSMLGWFWSFWPPLSQVTITTFNWSLVVYFGTMSIALLWWCIYARTRYTGPQMGFNNANIE